MTVQQRSVRLYRTQLHPCGYYPDREASNLVLDPDDPQVPRLFEFALEQGYRRAGDRLYRPSCPLCQACVPARIVIADFVPRRRHRRVLDANRDTRVDLRAATESDPHYELYRRYLQARHTGAGMDHDDPEGYSRFLLSSWADSRYLDIYLGDELIASAVTDCTPNAISAVYTYFNPALASRSLGTLAILQQIQFARDSGRSHLYLGFWIDGHDKMDYKRHWPALELRAGGERWRPAKAQES